MQSQDAADLFNAAVSALGVRRVRMLPEVLTGVEVRLQLLDETENYVLYEMDLVAPKREIR
jgi:hypothetical protein